LGPGKISLAHDEYDPITNSFINLIIIPGSKPEYVVFEANQEAGSPPATILAKFNDPNVAYLHSFSSTRRYVVIQLWPLSYGIKGLKIQFSNCLTDAMEWDLNRATRFVVIDRLEKRVVAEYQHPADFCFHTVNAFDDENGDVVMDMILHRTGEVVHAFKMADLKNSNDPAVVSNLRAFMSPSFVRIKLPNLQEERTRFVGGNLKMSPHAPNTEVMFVEYPNMEFPTINPKWRHDAGYQFVYAVAGQCRDMHFHALFDCLVKFDTRSRTQKRWMKVGHTPSEPVFVPNPEGDGSEDDGVVLSVVLDGSSAKSYLLVLDGKTFEQVAIADVGRPLPYGLHGAFV
ncbi:UNVERIFIED_CONTAM: hypothetical protein HDU68_006537, partial [Siphonaria sp. JEL0065]